MKGLLEKCCDSSGFLDTPRTAAAHQGPGRVLSCHDRSPHAALPCSFPHGLQPQRKGPPCLRPFSLHRLRFVPRRPALTLILQAGDEHPPSG